MLVILLLLHYSSLLYYTTRQVVRTTQSYRGKVDNGFFSSLKDGIYVRSKKLISRTFSTVGFESVLMFARMPGESYRRRLRSLLL